MKSKLEIYALAVCFACMVCLVISSGNGIYSIFKVAKPDLTMDAYQYERFQSNESFSNSSYNCSKTNDVEKQKPSDEEVTKQREEAFAKALKSEQRNGFQTLLWCIIYILVAGTVLFIHWRIAKRCRQ